jgi:hypothetical protein
VVDEARTETHGSLTPTTHTHGHVVDSHHHHQTDKHTITNTPSQTHNTNTQARFFVIKSFSPSDVAASVRHRLWASTEPGNARLDRWGIAGVCVFVTHWVVCVCVRGGGMDGWMDEWMDEWKDGWMDGCGRLDRYGIDVVVPCGLMHAIVVLDTGLSPACRS